MIGGSLAGNAGFTYNGTNVTMTSNLLLGSNIVHNGDTDTYIGFGTDTIDFQAGGKSFLTFTEVGTSGDTIVFNEGSANIDFRIESDDDANMFVMDAGNNRIGIRTDSPNVAFQINGDARLEESHKFYFSGDGNLGETTFIRGTSSDLELHSGDDLYFNATGDIRIDSDKVEFHNDASAKYLTISETGTTDTKLAGVADIYYNAAGGQHYFQNDVIIPDADLTLQGASRSVTATTFNGDLVGTIAAATTATTQGASDNSTLVATTAYVTTAVAAAGGGDVSASGTPVDNQLAVWTGATYY